MIYYLFILLILLNLIYIGHGENKLIIFLTILFILLLMGLNTYNSDFIAYKRWYETQEYEFNVEKGYLLLSYFIHELGARYNEYLLIYFFLILMLGIIVVRRLGGSLHCFLLMYMTTAMFMDTVEIRQTYAYFLYLVSLFFLSQNQELKGTIVIIFASLFQRSATVLLFIPVLFFHIKGFRKKLPLAFYLTLIACIIIFLNGNEMPGLREFFFLFLDEDKLIYFEGRTRYGFLLFFAANFLNYISCRVVKHRVLLLRGVSEGEKKRRLGFIDIVRDSILFLSLAMPFCMINSEFLRFFRFSVLPAIVLISLLFKYRERSVLEIGTEELCGKMIMAAYIIGYSAFFQHYRVVGEVLNNNALF